MAHYVFKVVLNRELPDSLNVEMSKSPIPEIELFVNIESPVETTYKAELIQSAVRLGLKWKEQIPTLTLSGGLDSEVVLQSFVESGIKFKVKILKFSHGLNSHDIQYAFEVCRKFNLTPETVELDILKFIQQGDFLEIADDYQSTSPQMTAHLWLREQTNSPIIFSGQAFRLQFRPEFILAAKSDTKLLYRDLAPYVSLIEPPSPNEFLFSRSNEKANSFSELNFLSMTPELRALACLVENPFERQLAAQELCSLRPAESFGGSQYFQEKFISGTTKYNFFRLCGFPVDKKPMKYTGFERVHYYYGLETDRKRQEFLERSSLSHSIPEDSDFRTQLNGLLKFNQLYRLPLQKKYAPSKEITLSFSHSFLELVRTKAIQDWSEGLTILTTRISQ